MSFRTALSLVKQCGGGKKIHLASQPHDVHLYGALLPRFQVDQGVELPGELEGWKGKVNNTGAA